MKRPLFHSPLLPHPSSLGARDTGALLIVSSDLINPRSLYGTIEYGEYEDFHAKLKDCVLVPNKNCVRVRTLETSSGSHRLITTGITIDLISTWSMRHGLPTSKKFYSKVPIYFYMKNHPLFDFTVMFCCIIATQDL